MYEFLLETCQTIEGDATVSLMVEYLRFRKGGSEKNAVFDER